jgi:hypothetical protein
MQGLGLTTLGRNVPCPFAPLCQENQKILSQNSISSSAIPVHVRLPSSAIAVDIRASAEDGCHDVLIHDRLRVEITVKVKANMQFKKIFEVAEVIRTTPSA